MGDIRGMALSSFRVEVAYTGRHDAAGDGGGRDDGDDGLRVGLPQGALAEAGSETRAVDQANLLLFPQGDAKALLGQSASVGADGAWTVADARAPGCEVAVRREKASFKSTRRVDAHFMTSIAANYAKVISLEARFGRRNTAEIVVGNTEILRADTRGACGDMIVDTVFVGRGKRTVTANAEAGGNANVQVGLVKAAPKVDAARSQDDVIEWSDDQAYGFSVKKNAKVEPLALDVNVPSVVTEGDDVEVDLASAAPAWLVVYYVDAKGHADVLWPSNEEPAPRSAPGKPRDATEREGEGQGLQDPRGVARAWRAVARDARRLRLRGQA